MVVDPVAWDAQVGPLRAAVVELATASPITTSPLADSVAMAELARESEFIFDGAGLGWGTDPVHRCHTMASQFMGLAADAAHAMAMIAEGGNQIAYSIIILLRPILEASGRAHQIHTATDLRSRLAISYNEYLSDLQFQRRSSQEEIAQRARTRHQQVLEAAAHLGFTLTKSRKNRPRQLAPPRISAAAAIERLMAPAIDPSVGALLHQYVSAVTHGGMSGLYSLLEPDREPRSIGKVYDGAAVMLSARHTNWLFAAAGHALFVAGNSKLRFCGIDALSDWESATDQYRKALQTLPS